MKTIFAVVLLSLCVVAHQTQIDENRFLKSGFLFRMVKAMLMGHDTVHKIQEAVNLFTEGLKFLRHGDSPPTAEDIKFRIVVDTTDVAAARRSLMRQFGAIAGMLTVIDGSDASVTKQLINHVLNAIIGNKYVSNIQSSILMLIRHTSENKVTEHAEWMNCFNAELTSMVTTPHEEDKTIDDRAIRVASHVLGIIEEVNNLPTQKTGKRPTLLAP